ncbi:hypothetical protein HY449_03185 [Candidatus Pacearchaeota archaeon]|nr:hypothetical protein [Candidatus Pacearchaeota archaeon]
MEDGNYEKLVHLISKSSSLPRDEIEKKVVAKRERISGLISKEGAAQIIAAELGVSLDGGKLKIDELLSGMKKVNVVGKILNISPVRSFTTKNGKEGKVVNLIVADETSNVKVVLWDLNHIVKIEKNEISHESVVEITNGMMRENELHLGNFSEIKLSGEEIGEVKTARVVKEKKISELNMGDNAKLRAFIVQAFEPKPFNVCKECRKKAVQEGDYFTCAEHGKTIPEKRFLMNFVLDDGTGTIRAVAFHENLKNLGFADFENPEILARQREQILGKEMFFSGNVRMNKFFNNQEFSINAIEGINIDELIAVAGKNGI